jgi:hypothetical protein
MTQRFWTGSYWTRWKGTTDESFRTPNWIPFSQGRSPHGKLVVAVVTAVIVFGLCLFRRGGFGRAPAPANRYIPATNSTNLVIDVERNERRAGEGIHREFEATLIDQNVYRESGPMVPSTALQAQSLSRQNRREEDENAIQAATGIHTGNELRRAWALQEVLAQTNPTNLNTVDRENALIVGVSCVAIQVQRNRAGLVGPIQSAGHIVATSEAQTSLERLGGVCQTGSRRKQKVPKRVFFVKEKPALSRKAQKRGIYVTNSAFLARQARQMLAIRAAYILTGRLAPSVLQEAREMQKALGRPLIHRERIRLLYHQCWRGRKAYKKAQKALTQQSAEPLPTAAETVSGGKASQLANATFSPKGGIACGRPREEATGRGTLTGGPSRVSIQRYRNRQDQVSLTLRSSESLSVSEPTALDSLVMRHAVGVRENTLPASLCGSSEKR